MQTFDSILRSNRTIWFILAAATLIRFTLILSSDPYGGDTIDGMDYHNHALSLLHGQGYPAHGSLPFVRPPLYPVLLSYLYFLFPHDSYLTARIFNAVLDTAALFVAYKLVLLIWNNLAAANLSSVIYAINPLYIFFTVRVRVEALFILLSVTGIYLLIKEYKAGFPRMVNIFFTGLIFGLLCLCRSNGTVLLVLVPLWLLLCNFKNIKRAVAVICLFVLGFVVVISPWTIRNYYRYGEFIPITDGLGYNIWVSNTDIKLQDLRARTYEEYIESDKQFWLRTSEIEKTIQDKSLRERDAHYFQLGTNYIKNNFSTWVWLTILKFVEFWSPAARFDMQGWKAVLTLPFGLLMYFGLFFYLKSYFSRDFDKRIWFLIAILIASSTVTGVLTWSSIRFRVPLVDLYVIPFGMFWLQNKILNASVKT